MKKQPGFTLIELMVVMAIIAILATAGLAAYTGYIKKARDTTRIADLAAINTIVLGEMSSTGTAPLIAALRTAITSANNGATIYDPLNASITLAGTGSCVASDAASPGTTSPCTYQYQTCDSQTGYRILAKFESTSNKSLYNATSISLTTNTPATNTFYTVGTCLASPTPTAVDATTWL